MKTIHDKLCDLHLNKLGNLRTCEKLNASHDLIEQLTLHASYYLLSLLFLYLKLAVQ